MNEMIPVNLSKSLPARLRQLPIDNEFGAGIESTYGIVGYKGKVWSIRYRGENTALLREDGDGPRNSIEVVILRSSLHKSKIFYEGGYVDGSSEAPDCFSTNGVTPDPGARDPQNSNCAACPMNAWGSRTTDSGKKGKRCADSKRVAVTPSGDLNNELYGGPMLLRIPAASLADFAQYGDKLRAMGIAGYAVVTKISFDSKEAFPKFVFQAVRTVTEDEIDTILQLREGDKVARILSEEQADVAPTTPPADMAHLAPPPAKGRAEEPVKEEPVKEEPVKEQPKAAKPKAKPTPIATATDVADDETAASPIDDDLDAELESLLPSTR